MLSLLPLTRMKYRIDLLWIHSRIRDNTLSVNFTDLSALLMLRTSATLVDLKLDTLNRDCDVKIEERVNNHVRGVYLLGKGRQNKTE